MQEQKPENIEYGNNHELQMARMEREMKRLWIVILVLASMLFLSNLAWMAYESQFETIAYEQDGSGVNNIGTNVLGGIYNGTESESAQEEAGRNQGD